MSLSPFRFNIVLEVLVRATKQEKDRKGILIGKGEINLYFFFTNGMSLCIENPKDFKKNLLELINEFSEVTRHKVSVQKSGAFPCVCVYVCVCVCVSCSVMSDSL